MGTRSGGAGRGGRSTGRTRFSGGINQLRSNIATQEFQTSRNTIDRVREETVSLVRRGARPERLAAINAESARISQEYDRITAAIRRGENPDTNVLRVRFGF